MTIVEVDVPDVNGGADRFGPTMTMTEARDVAEDTPLSPEQRRSIIDQAVLCLDNLYVHRDLKRARHAVDPVTALRRLRRESDGMEALAFHLQIMRIFKGLRDIHTAYILPRPWRDMIAYLPFLLDAYDRETAEDAPDAARDPTVIVASTLDGFRHPHFRRGVRIRDWNGMPIHAAIQRVGREEQGSNPAARFALGQRLMTVRWFGGSLPPEEDHVTLCYLDAAGTAREIRFFWRVLTDPAQRIASLQAMWEIRDRDARADDGIPSLDHRALVEKCARRSLFPRGATAEAPRLARNELQLPDLPPGVFTAWHMRLDPGPNAFSFGVIRIAHFNLEPDGFRDAFLSLLGRMPPDGLVLDIRSNPGGEVAAAEGILRALAPGPIQPLPFQFMATDLVDDLVGSTTPAAVKDLSSWRQLVRPALDNGSQFSRFAPLTDPDRANATGRLYAGPVLLLTNAVTYSSGDIFAAGFQDNAIGRVIGTDASTGGGGANMWWHRSAVTYAGPDGDLQPLPGGAQLHLAVRRCTRVGSKAGLPIEEAGVTPDVRYHPTRRDILDRDADLLVFAGEMLRTAPVGR